MLNAMICLVALIATAVALVVIQTGGQERLPKQFLVLPGLSLFIAAICGTLSLALTPLTLKFRRTPPPRGLTVGVVVLGTLPWLAILVQSLLGR